MFERFRRYAISSGCSASVLLSIALFPIAPAHATDGGGTAGLFEIDGDLGDSASGDPLDWETAATPPMLDAVVVDDPNAAYGEDDDVFGTDSKENSPSDWRFKIGSVPQKSDIDEARLAARVIDGRVWLYASASRTATSGTMNLSFEFNQGGDRFVSSQGEERTARSPGDLMVMVGVTQGGQVSELVLYGWAGTAAAGQWKALASGGTWLAATNHGQNELERDQWNFVELALDLTSFGVAPDCGGFGEAWVKTNSTMGTGADGLFKDDGVLKDHTERHRFDLATDPSSAATASEARGVQAEVAGQVVLDEGYSASRRAGQTGTDDPAPDRIAAIPGEPVATATSIEVDTVSAIGGTAAESTASAQTADLVVLGGVVRADAVRASARATAHGRDAQVSAAGSIVERVLIDHDNDAQTAPLEAHGSALNVVVQLEPAVFGPDSYVAVLEVVPAVDDGDPATEPVFTAKPGADQLEGGRFEAGLRVNGIHVHVTGGLVPAADVIVSQASADAAFPQSFACTIPQQVSGSALVASVQSSAELGAVRQGLVSVPPATGGEADQQLFQIDIPGVLVAQAGTSRAEGVIDAAANASSAASFAELKNVCLLPTMDAAGEIVACAFALQAVRSDATAQADGGAAGTEGDARSAGAVAIIDRDGRPVPTRPDDGPELEIPGIARVFFDVQELVEDPLGSRSSRIAVTAIVVEQLDPEHAGAVIRVAQADAGAFAPPSATPLPEPGATVAFGAGALALIALRGRVRRSGSRVKGRAGQPAAC